MRRYNAHLGINMVAQTHLVVCGVVWYIWVICGGVWCGVGAGLLQVLWQRKVGMPAHA